MNEYVIYARKSTESEDRQALSIDAQLKELTIYSAKNELNVTKTYTESHSAKRSGRPVFGEMVKNLRRKPATGVICWKLDRLTRNLADAALISELMDLGKIKEIHTPTQTYGNSSTDKFMSGIDFLVARKYIDDLSENVKRGFDLKMDRGWFPGRAPAGYLNVTDSMTGLRTIEPDPERFHQIKKMWTLLLSKGYSMPTIVKIANERWAYRSRPTRKFPAMMLTVSQLHKIFTNPFYAGRVRHGSREAVGQHKRMVSDAQFQRAQKILRGDTYTRPKRYSFEFRGLFRCGNCGCMITAETKYKQIKKTDSKRKYIYYHCTHRGKVSCKELSITDSELVRQIVDYLGSISIPDSFLSWALKYLEDWNSENTLDTRKTQQQIKREIERIDQRLKNLLSLKISPDNESGVLLTDADYLDQKQQLENERATLRQSLNGVNIERDMKVNSIRDSLQFSSLALKAFKNGDSDVRREIISCLGSNHELTNKTLHFQLKSPLKELVHPLDPSDTSGSRFTPNSELSSAKRLQTANAPVAKRGRRYDVRTKYKAWFDKTARIKNVEQMFQLSDYLRGELRIMQHCLRSNNLMEY